MLHYDQPRVDRFYCYMLYAYVSTYWFQSNSYWEAVAKSMAYTLFTSAIIQPKQRLVCMRCPWSGPVLSTWNELNMRVDKQSHQLI